MRTKNRYGSSRCAGLLLCAAMLASLSPASAAEPPANAPRLKILFLGDHGHHRPGDRFRQLFPVMSARGIDLAFTDDVHDLNAATLAKYDGLLIYANIEKISPAQEQALLDYVASGRGFIPLHCASYCFLNSEKYIALVGAQFQRHGTGTFRVAPADASHPIVRGYGGFESWDETYVHTRHNEQDRTVLEYRQEGDAREPWTWIRTHGKGRVFYTAWGHDERTWGHPGFHNLLERGIRWAVGGDPGVVPDFTDRPPMTEKRKDVQPLKYADSGGKIPNYIPSRQWGAQGEPIRQMQLPLPPDESQKHFVTPVGFEVRLFVSEPQLEGKPICMTWDERGRLWVAETVDYPNELQKPGEGRDRIRICEDTDGDGMADKFTVFAEKLSIPTSMLHYRGGLIVHQAPDTLFFRDINGDDVADERHVLFTGWSTSDTHAGPSNLRYGLDNYLYGIVGYAGFEGTIGGERHSFRTGFYRLRGAAYDGPQSSDKPPFFLQLEFLRNTNNNSWGVGISEEGILFGSTANGNPSEYMPIANRYYEAVRGWSSTVLSGIAGNAPMRPVTEKVRQVDWHGHFTAAAGHALYTARNYPPVYWNQTAFVCEPTGHLAATFLLQRNGAGFTSRNAWNLLASDDEWSSPIVAEVGPDGNVWVIDWYNYIVQHNPTPAGFKTGKGNAYETDLRDKKHGRIYRLVYVGDGAKADIARPYRPRSLHGASPAQLLDALQCDNMFWRLHAQRLLVERGQTDVVPNLIALARNPNVDAIGLNVGAIHALWTLHGLGAMQSPAGEAAAIEALGHASAGVRRNAVQVLPRSEKGLTALLERGLPRDCDDQVRLAALLTLAEMPPSAAAANEIVALLASDSIRNDRWLLDAATAAAARHDVQFLTAAAGIETETAEKLPADRLAIVAEHVARGGQSEALAVLLPALANASPRVAESVIVGLERGWPRDASAKLSPAAEESVLRLLAQAPPATRGSLVRLGQRLGMASLEKQAAQIAESFLRQAGDGKETDAARIAAARQVIEFRRTDPAAAAQILELISPRTSPELAQGLLEAVARSEAAETGQAVLRARNALAPSARAVALRLLMSRAEWTATLVAALENGDVPLGDLTLDQRQALLAHRSREIRQRVREILARGGGLPNPDRQKVIDELLPVANEQGDVAAGKEVFKKHCAKCHTHGGEGTKVGPDLTGMAVHPKHELLVQILDPSRSVEGNYRAYSLLTSDGRTMTGLLASESRTAIELFDAEGKKHVLLREDIEQLEATPKSLMPEGFEKQLSPRDLANLLVFLTQRGKYLPIPLDKAATIVTTKGMFHSEDANVERLIFSDWSPKTFEGIPFQLCDPQGDRQPNAIMLYGPTGKFPPTMPRSVTLPCNTPAKAIHFLSGVSGWGWPASEKGSVSLIVRLHYAGGESEDHELKNGEHFADYIRRVDVPKSKLAFMVRGQQVRYLAVQPKRPDLIEKIELVKGPDNTAPVVMAVTVEPR